MVVIARMVHFRESLLEFYQGALTLGRKNRSSSLSDNISDIKSSGKMQLNNGSALSPVFDADADPTRYLPICCCVKGSMDRNRLVYKNLGPNRTDLY